LGRVVEVRAGRVRPFASRGRMWTSGIATLPVETAYVAIDGIAGDEHADRRHHGGPEKALFVYPVEHYPAWRSELGLCEMGAGAFGENLVLAGCDERAICVGDVVRIGEVVAEVSQPRRPCWN